MPNEFEVVRSDKVGLDSKESYIVIRNSISFLRILGEDPLLDGYDCHCK